MSVLSALAIFINMTYLFRFLGYFLLGDFVVRLFGEPVVYDYCYHMCSSHFVPAPWHSASGVFYLRPRLRCNFACLFASVYGDYESFALSRCLRVDGDYVGEFSRITVSACSYVCITARRLRSTTFLFLLAGLPGNSLSVSYKNKNDRSSCRRCVLS